MQNIFGVLKLTGLNFIDLLFPNEKKKEKKLKLSGTTKNLYVRGNAFQSKNISGLLII